MTVFWGIQFPDIMFLLSVLALCRYFKVNSCTQIDEGCRIVISIELYFAVTQRSAGGFPPHQGFLEASLLSWAHFNTAESCHIVCVFCVRQKLLCLVRLLDDSGLQLPHQRRTPATFLLLLVSHTCTRLAESCAF